MADDQGKRKRGRPKGKPLSDAELAQRRTAAWKTGEHAQSSLGPLAPCKKGSCPLEYPCDTKRARDEKGIATERCAPRMAVDPALHQAFLRARVDGNTDALAPIHALLLSQMTELASGELERLSVEGGFSIVESFYTKDGDLVEKTVENPRGRGALKLLEMIGATADQQQVTPKSRNEGDRDKSAASLFDFLAATRKALDS